MGMLIGDIASQPYFKTWGCFRGRIGYFPNGGTPPSANLGGDNSIEYLAPGFAPNDGLIRFENFKTRVLAILGPMLTTDVANVSFTLVTSVANDDQDRLVGSVVTFDNLPQTAAMTLDVFNSTTLPFGQALPVPSIDIVSVSNMTAY